ncbi:MAG: acetate kinase [Kiritimatiellaeota bacterium]|nr:acetate kinase [Kiritimatiellota bacterium]
MAIDRILIVNSGSSSLKFTLYSMATETMLAKGLVERIGTPSANLAYQRVGDVKTETPVEAETHAEALKLATGYLADPHRGVVKSLDEVEAIGHRVVHGGEKFHAPTLINDTVKHMILECAPLAPLHNPANLGGILACEQVFPGVPNVAVFDTAFHQTMEPHAYLYAIPLHYYKTYGIRKYGFHGTSHNFIMHATAAYLGKKVETLKIITCHLGNGSSVAAIDRGKVVDTSMGMTPLAGVIMGTRSGDIDPAVVLFLVRQGMTPDQIDAMLNKKSGLLGVGDIDSGDMRDIVDNTAAGNEHAARALNMWVHRLVYTIGGYNALLGGADAIVLAGGIGENSIPARAKLVKALSSLGCILDEERNKKRGPVAVTTDDSRVPVLVIPTDEELMIARETFAIASEKA